MRKLSCIYLILCLICMSCFNKQDNDITKPNVPEYILSGSTLDYVTGEPVPNVGVNIKAVMLNYTVDFPEQSVQSDSLGRYVIDPVYPGGYTISVVKDNYKLHEKSIQIEHENRDLLLNIPDIYFGQKFPINMELDFNTSFIHSNFVHPCFAIYNLAGLFPSEKWSGLDFLGYHFCKSGYFDYTWKWQSHIKLDFDPTVIWQMEIDRNFYIAMKYPDSLMIFDKWTSSLLNTFSTGTILKDIAYNQYDNTLYACSDSMLYSVDIAGKTVTELANLPLTGIHSMSWNNNLLYLYNKTENLLYKVNLQLQIDNIYAVINQSTDLLLLDIYDMHFDSMDRLWCTTL